MSKTKELVFHRQNPRGLLIPPTIPNINRIKFAKILGIFVMDTLGAGNKQSTFCKYVINVYISLICLTSKDWSSRNYKMFSMLLLCSELHMQQLLGEGLHRLQSATLLTYFSIIQEVGNNDRIYKYCRCTRCC